jgi:enoyl-CoA hydratase/carnithine racemase
VPVVLYEKDGDGSVAVVTLNRPEVLNAYDVTMRDGLYECLEAVRDDPDVRVMVLQGNGRAFCTGGDIHEFGSAPSPVGAREVRWRRDVWGTLWRLPKITLAAVHGVAVGGGFEMALLCDQCIAATDARFALPEVGLGMIPGVAGTQTAPRLVGLGRGVDVVVAARWLDARTARRWGIAAKVVPPQRLRSEALRYARRLARLPSAAVAALKRAVNDGLDHSLVQGLDLEKRCERTLRDACRTAEMN